MTEPITVLQVDDNQDFLAITEKHLQRVDEPLELTGETSADEALATIETGGVDCVVSDFDMPEMTGLELLEAVRDSYPDRPFILFTGKGSETVASDAIAAGVTAYLQKKGETSQYERLANRIVNAVKQYRAEREVVETRERLQRIHEHTAEFVLLIDDEGYVQEATSSIRRVLDVDPETMTGTRPGEFTHPDDVEPLEESFETLLEHPDEEVTVEFRMQHGDGSWRWVEGRGRNRLDDPVVGAVVATLRDVTERERRERELRRQNERLEEFAEIVSHDLQSPLNVAKGRITLAQDDCETPHLADAATAVERMEELIENTLELAASGRTVGEAEPVDLATLAREAWENVETHGAAVVVETDRSVRADPERLQNLFENLYRNSVEHGSTGSRPEADDSVMHGANVAAEDVVVDDADPILTVSVGDLDDGFFLADDGRGIPEDDHGAVFESDFSTSEEGTGFGLAIVKRIAEAHGWSVTVTESADGGARFEFAEIDVA